MPRSTTLSPSESVLSSLSTKVRARVREAEKYCREATTLYDFGIARGLLLALKKDGQLSKKQFNSLFDRLHSLVPPSIIDSIPMHLRAEYRPGVIVPASASTLAER